MCHEQPFPRCPKRYKQVCFCGFRHRLRTRPIIIKNRVEAYFSSPYETPSCVLFHQLFYPNRISPRQQCQRGQLYYLGSAKDEKLKHDTICLIQQFLLSIEFCLNIREDVMCDVTENKIAKTGLQLCHVFLLQLFTFGFGSLCLSGILLHSVLPQQQKYQWVTVYYTDWSCSRATRLERNVSNFIQQLYV